LNAPSIVTSHTNYLPNFLNSFWWGQTQYVCYIKGGFYLDTDASDYQIGAVLSQMQDGQLKVISYESRLLNKDEKNYCVTDKELLAVRYFIEYYMDHILNIQDCLFHYIHNL
jgi:hypothetical protein